MTGPAGAPLAIVPEDAVRGTPNARHLRGPAEPRERATVLVADDDPANRVVLRRDFAAVPENPQTVNRGTV
jgi:hypothetical protein